VYITGVYKTNSKDTCNIYIPTTSTRENFIQLGTFLDSLNEMIHDYTSPYKDSNASIRIAKPPPIVG